MTMYAARIWPVEVPEGVEAVGWEAVRCEGSAGSDAVWCHEPSYWSGRAILIDGVIGREPDERDWYSSTFVLGREEMRVLDIRFRGTPAPATPEQLMLHSAFADSSPFLRFRVHAYEWDTGLPDLDS